MAPRVVCLRCRVVSLGKQPAADLPRRVLSYATGRGLGRIPTQPPLSGIIQEPHVERVGQGGTSPIQSSYEPNTCEPPTDTSSNEPVASCPDGTVAYGDGVCATTGLKGPPTPAQQFVANLSNTEQTIVSPVQLAPAALLHQPAESQRTAEVLIEGSKDLVMDVLNGLYDELKGGKKIERTIRLSNNYELKVSAGAILGKDSKGKAALSVRATGSIVAKFPTGSSDATFAYSRDHNGQQTLRLGVCYFYGPGVKVEGLVDAKGQAGLCASYKDATGTDATLQLDLVGKAGASLHLSENWSWSHHIETRHPLVKATLSEGLLR
jgi:hypothetical protein